MCIVRNGVVRFESVMELRRMIEDLGKMEGVQEKEKGESPYQIPHSDSVPLRSGGAPELTVQEHSAHSTLHTNQVPYVTV